MNLVENFKPCFSLALDFLAARGLFEGETPGQAPLGPEAEEQPEIKKFETLAELRENFLALLNQSEQDARAAIDPERALIAKKMVAAWIDEAILNASPPDRQFWLRQPLQSEFSLPRQAGVWFFKALDELDSDKSEDRALAALALRCLSLGFKGCWYDNPLGLWELRKEKSALFKPPSPNLGFPAPLPRIKKIFVSNQSLKLIVLALLLLILFWGGQHRYLDYLETKLDSKLRKAMPVSIQRIEEPQP